MSPDNQQHEHIAGIVRTTRIIVLALCFGVLTFAIVVVMQARPDPQAPLGILTILSSVFALAAIVMSITLPRLIAANQCRQIAAGNWKAPRQSPAASALPDDDITRLAAVYPTKTIVGAALLEGAAFFALMAHFIEHHVASLALAGLLWLGLLLYLPTTAQVNQWIQDRLRWIEEFRQFHR